ncbi:hypothetical protein Tco_1341381 [Tanacetum coccineum]
MLRIRRHPILRIGQYSVSEDPILRISQYFVSEEPTLRIGQYVWKKSYESGDYDYDPYDDDMYEGQEIPDKLHSIYDKLDIKVRGRKKK